MFVPSNIEEPVSFCPPQFRSHAILSLQFRSGENLSHPQFRSCEFGPLNAGLDSFCPLNGGPENFCPPPFTHPWVSFPLISDPVIFVPTIQVSRVFFVPPVQVPWSFVPSIQVSRVFLYLQCKSLGVFVPSIQVPLIFPPLNSDPLFLSSPQMQQVLCDSCPQSKSHESCILKSGLVSLCPFNLGPMRFQPLKSGPMNFCPCKFTSHKLLSLEEEVTIIWRMCF